MGNLFDRQAAFSKARGEVGIDQIALAKQLKANNKAKELSVKKKIPQGHLIPKLLITELDLEEAVYTWLRTSANWSEMTISFAADPSKYQLTEEVLHRYSHPEIVTLPWKRKTKDEASGLWHLREVIAKALLKHNNIVKVTIDRKGVKLFTDKQKKFNPYRKATAHDVADFNKEIKAELERLKTLATERQEEWEEPEIPKLEVGMDINNEEFVPYIEYVKDVVVSE